MSQAPKRDAQEPEEAAPAAEHLARPRLNAVGEERPRFLLDFPEHPELEPLIQAFEAGDFARVRREAPLLARLAREEGVRRAALELRQRVEPDPLLIVLLVFAISLFVFLVAWIYTQ